MYIRFTTWTQNPVKNTYTHINYYSRHLLPVITQAMQDNDSPSQTVLLTTK